MLASKYVIYKNIVTFWPFLETFVLLKKFNVPNDMLCQLFVKIEHDPWNNNYQYSIFYNSNIQA